MLAVCSLLAALEPMGGNPIPDAQPSKLFGLGVRDLLLVVGAAVVIGLFLFLWVYLTYKGRHHSAGHRLSKPIYRAEKGSAQDASQRVKVRRRRRRHPDNLPRNPTLGETGGLPPLRPDEPPARTAQPE